MQFLVTWHALNKLPILVFNILKFQNSKTAHFQKKPGLFQLPYQLEYHPTTLCIVIYRNHSKSIWSLPVIYMLIFHSGENVLFWKYTLLASFIGRGYQACSLQTVLLGSHFRIKNHYSCHDPSRRILGLCTHSFPAGLFRFIMWSVHPRSSGRFHTPRCFLQRFCRLGEQFLRVSCVFTVLNDF